jgi:hypothetical protein
MSTPDEARSEHDIFERRSKKRYIINESAVIFFAGYAGVFSCFIRDITNDGTGLRLKGLPLVPAEFGVSFDNFRTTRRCRLIWRDGDLVGAVFEA